MARRDKGTGSLSKRNDGMWVASIELPPGPDGKRRRKTAARKNRGDAQRELRRMRSDLDATGDLDTSTVRLADWMDTYLSKIAAQRDAPNTLKGKVAANRDWITPCLGKKRLDRLTPDDVRRLHEYILTTPRDRRLRDLPRELVPADAECIGASTAAVAHNTLAAALTAAVKEGKVRANVTAVVDKPKGRRTDDNALATDQAIELAQAIRDDPLAPLWLFFMLTGARRGEALGLEVDRVSTVVDLSWQLLELTDVPDHLEARRVGNGLWLTRPKTQGSWRTPPNVPPISTVLDKAIDGRTAGLVFTMPDGSPLRPSYVSKRWKALLKEHGMPPHVTLHGTRHTAVDLLYELGTPEHIIMQIVGHSNRSMTRSYRTRLDLDSAGNALRSLGERLAIE